MEPDVLIKIAGMGLLIAVICQVLSKAGREDIATLVTVAGVILVFFTVLDLATELFARVQAVFQFP